MKFSNVNKSELLTGLTNLKFLENFQAFSVELSLSSGEEARIENSLRPKRVSYWIVVRETGDNGRLVEGPTEWTTNHVYLKNAGSGSMTATVIFFA